MAVESDWNPGRRKGACRASAPGKKRGNLDLGRKEGSKGKNMSRGWGRVGYLLRRKKPLSESGRFPNSCRRRGGKNLLFGRKSSRSGSDAFASDDGGPRGGCYSIHVWGGGKRGVSITRRGTTKPGIKGGEAFSLCVNLLTGGKKKKKKSLPTEKKRGGSVVEKRGALWIKCRGVRGGGTRHRTRQGN